MKLSELIEKLQSQYDAWGDMCVALEWDDVDTLAIGVYVDMPEFGPGAAVLVIAGE